MTPQEALSTALGYAWGREDASGTRTVSPTDAPGSLTFAEAYQKRQAAFIAEDCYWMPSVPSAYGAWQAAAGLPDWVNLQFRATMRAKLPTR